MVAEVPLVGGYVCEVVRVGDTVRRRPPASMTAERRTYVRSVLESLEAAGWDGSPRFLGVDDQGRDVLSWVEGFVPLDGDGTDGLESADSVRRVGEMVRELHDLLPAGHGGEVVCHNDLSPRNTVYRDARPVAFIDWDLAAPGERVHDVAHVCWQWACRSPASVDAACALVRAVVDGYRLGDADRAVLVDTILWWQDRCWRGIQALIDAGDPAVERLQQRGAVALVQADEAWTERHRRSLEAAMAIR